MTTVIAIANGKGGVGKSTVAINLAGALARHNASIFLVDADPQGTTSDWYRHRQTQERRRNIHANFHVTAAPWTVQDMIEKLEKQTERYNITIIDCGPANNKTMRTAFAFADCAVVPVTPSPYDINSVKRTIDMLQEGKREVNLKVKPYLLVSRKIVGTSLGEEARKALGVFNIPILKTEICQRVALCEAGIAGLTIGEYSPSSQAAEEFENLGKEVLQWLKRN